MIQFLRETLQQAAHTTAPIVAAAHAAPNHVANRATRLQGKALLSLARRVFANELTGTPLTEDPPPEVRRHYAPVFGALCALLKIGEEDALSLFFFMQLRSMISAAVRLNIIGPIEGQAVQWRLAPFAEELAAEGVVELDEIARRRPCLICGKERKTDCIHDYSKANERSSSRQWPLALAFPRS